MGELPILSARATNHTLYDLTLRFNFYSYSFIYVRVLAILVFCRYSCRSQIRACEGLADVRRAHILDVFLSRS